MWKNTIISKIALLCMSLTLLSSCDAQKTLTIQNNTKQPIQVLLKGSPNQTSMLNPSPTDTIIVLGSDASNNNWHHVYGKGKWERTQLTKIKAQSKNSLYLEVYDFQNQRIQIPKIQIKEKRWAKNKIKILVRNH